MSRDTKVYQLTVGKPLDLDEISFTPTYATQTGYYDLDDYINEDDLNGYVFTEHQITFALKKASDKPELNSGTVTIYNLDDETALYLKNNVKNHLTCSLKAGDNESCLNIFRGTITAVVDDFSAETRKTKLTLSDGGANVKNAYTVRSYTRGTSKQKILSDFMSDLKLPVGTLKEVEGTIDAPASFLSPTWEAISAMSKRWDTNVSIQNGKLSVLPLNTRKTVQASYISSDTGLLGQVTVYSDNTKTTATSEDQEASAIQFRCLLDGAIYPDEMVYVKDGDYDGAYKVLQVDYNGDFEGNTWECRVVASEAEYTL